MNWGVGFDLDHTIAIDHHLETRVLHRMLINGGAAPADAGREAADAVARYRAGGLALSAALAPLFPGPSLPESLSEFKRRCVAGAATQCVALPGLHSLLARLREAHIPYGVLSNGWNPLQRAKLEAIGYDGIALISDDIGARKPEARAFELLRAALGGPERCWYVGDDPHGDVEGALGAGLSAVWFDDGTTAWPGDLSPPPERVTELAEVACVLGLDPPAPERER